MIGRLVRPRLEMLMQRQLDDGSGPPFDFKEPPGEPALVSHDSVSWTVFANPVSLLVGGITAVILELAEAKVRSGVWDHTTFRTDPLRRMRRTGLAAMITVYGAGSRAEKMIAGVRKMHDRVQGTTPDGIPYQANDPELLRWVHATAAYGFLQAYHRYVSPLSPAARDAYYAEGVPVSLLYGASSPPASEAELNELMSTMRERLEPSAILSEFLSIMAALPLLPWPLRFMNRFFIDAAIDLLPDDIQRQLLLQHRKPGPCSRAIVRMLAWSAERLRLDASPAVQAHLRMARAELRPTPMEEAGEYPTTV